MNCLAHIAAYPLAHALGWTLLHFCWQGAVVATLLWCVLGALGRRSSQTRYAASCFALALLALLPLLTFVRLAVQDYRLAKLTHNAPIDVATIFVQADVAGPPAPWPLRLAVVLDHCVPWVLALWLAGVVLFLARLNLGLLAARRMRSAGTVVSPDLQHLFRQLCARLGIYRAVRLLHSASVQVPTVIGWLRPVVLLPVSCLTGLSPAQVEALLCHELAHVRRHDYLVSVIQSVVETLLFYHPAVWWVSKQVRRERECCCDELAVSNGSDVLAYARALSWLEEQRACTPQLVLGANGGVLTMRIRRLLGYPEGSAASQFASIALLAIFAVSTVVFLGRLAYAEASGSQAATAPAQVQAPAELSSPSVSAAGASLDRAASPEPTAGGRSGAETAVALPIREESEQPETLATDDNTRKFLTAQLDALKVRLENQNVAYDALLERRRDGQQLNENDLRRLEEIRQALEESRSQYNELLAKLSRVLMAAALEARTQAAQAATANADTSEFKKQMEQLLAQRSLFAQESAPPPPATAATTDSVSPQNVLTLPAGAVQGNLIHRVNPVYPPIAKAAHLQGVVVLDARISKEGTVEDVSPVSGPSMLQASAVDAVRQWTYKPYMVDGEPVAVHTTITVNFTFAGAGNPPAGGIASGDGPAPLQYDTAGNPVRTIADGVFRPEVIYQVQPEYTDEARKAKFMGTVMVQMIVNVRGVPENVHVLRGVGMGLDEKAVQAISQYRFKPAMENGKPVPVLLNVQVNFRIFDPPKSPQTFSAGQPLVIGVASGDIPPPPQIDSAGNSVRRIGDGVLAPAIIHQVEPEFTTEARKAKFMGNVLVGLIVNEQGIPEDVHIVRGVGMGLNDKAIEAVKQYKFRPALDNGVAVPVELNVEVNFQVF